ncbi:MAG TPA: hypothetical protein VGA13_06595 [Acidimicrobiales bacterium]
MAVLPEFVVGCSCQLGSQFSAGSHHAGLDRSPRDPEEASGLGGREAVEHGRLDHGPQFRAEAGKCACEVSVFDSGEHPFLGGDVDSRVRDGGRAPGAAGGADR